MDRPWLIFVVGWKGFNYPLIAYMENEQLWEDAQAHPEWIFFQAQVMDLDVDVNWFDKRPGPNWNTDISVDERVMSEAGNSETAPTESG